MGTLLRLGFAGFVALAAMGPRSAEACGGTFCDTGPTAMPVDQSGENILFVIDGTFTEAHVQIQYQGSAERFAWVVPMQQIPEVTVGSQLLFQNLLQTTVPTYGYQTQQDFCGAPNGSGGQTSGGSGGGGGGLNMDGSAGGPSVVYKKTVGAFEVVALQGGTAQEVSDWLTANAYQTIPNAASILQTYVAKSFVFVAIKLTGGAGVDEIHPLVFKYAGTEPCVPLQLTAVAATEDMGVRTFFLGDDRVVPSNYKHVELNPVRIDWQQFASNYLQVVSRGADSPIANGQAFATEYAGANNLNKYGQGMFSDSWNYLAFQSIAPENVVTELQAQGLLSCMMGPCQFNHPLVEGLLADYLPPPTGMDKNQFWSDLPAYKAQIDMTAWDAAGFSTDFKDRIQDPGKHAADLVTKWPYLTRMFTTLSPSEMTLDPVFHARPGLPPVAAGQQGTLRITCEGDQGMILPDGRQVALDASNAWPAWDSLMPWVEKIEEYVEGGSVLTLVDNTAQIDALLLAWNESQGWPPPGSGGSGGGVGSGGSGANAGSGGAAGAGANSANGAEPSGGGCGCSLPGSAPASALGLFLLAGAAALARRRSRRG